MVAVGLIPLAILAISLHMRIDSDLRAANERDLDARLEVAAAQVGGYIGQHVQVMRFTAALPASSAMQGDALEPTLAAVGRLDPDFANVHVVNTEGMDIARSDDQPNVPFNDRAWFKDVIGGKELAFQTIISRATGKPALAMATRVTEGSDVVGVINASLDLGKVGTVVSRAKIGETGFVWMVDDKDKTVASRDTAAVTAQKVASEHPAIVAARKGDTASVIRSRKTARTGSPWRA
jgi:methyl-accepting chemotaxis protein